MHGRRLFGGDVHVRLGHSGRAPAARGLRDLRRHRRRPNDEHGRHLLWDQPHEESVRRRLQRSSRAYSLSQLAVGVGTMIERIASRARRSGTTWTESKGRDFVGGSSRGCRFRSSTRRADIDDEGECTAPYYFEVARRWPRAALVSKLITRALTGGTASRCSRSGRTRRELAQRAVTATSWRRILSIALAVVTPWRCSTAPLNASARTSQTSRRGGVHRSASDDRHRRS